MIDIIQSLIDLLDKFSMEKGLLLLCFILAFVILKLLNKGRE